MVVGRILISTAGLRNKLHDREKMIGKVSRKKVLYLSVNKAYR